MQYKFELLVQGDSQSQTEARKVNCRYSSASKLKPICDSFSRNQSEVAV